MQCSNGELLNNNFVLLLLLQDTSGRITFIKSLVTNGKDQVIVMTDRTTPCRGVVAIIIFKYLKMLYNGNLPLYTIVCNVLLYLHVQTCKYKSTLF